MARRPAKLYASCPATDRCPGIAEDVHDRWHEGEYGYCETEYRKTLKSCPRCPAANSQLIDCLLALGHTEQSDALVEKLLPTSATDFVLAGFILSKARLITLIEGDDAAAPWYREAQNLLPLASYPALAAQARALRRKRRKARAAETANEALAQRPFDPPIIDTCIRILIWAGHEEDARTHLLALAKTENVVASYYAAVARCLVDVGLEKRGLAVGWKAANEHPESLAVACIVSRVLLQSKKHKRAAVLLRRLLKLDPAGHGKMAMVDFASIAAEQDDVEGVLKWSIEAYTNYPGPDTRKLVTKATKLLTGELHDRQAAFTSLAQEYARTRSQQAKLEAALAGYDTKEQGTNLEFARAEGEGWNIEFMEKMPDQARDLAIEIAAFSSREDGGTIYLGVDDDANVPGVSDLETTKQRDDWRHRVAQIATKAVQPPNPVTVYFNSHEGRNVIKVWVPEGSAAIYYVDNIPYLRNLDESRKATPAEVDEFHARRSPKKPRVKRRTTRGG